MDFADIVKRRFSVRKYLNKPVEEDKLMAVLDAGRLAPSACNFQPWHFIVITDPERRQSMAEVYHQAWFIDAPIIIGVLLDREKAWKRSDGMNYGGIDAAIAMDHMILQAAELGLGTCWIGAFNPEKATEILDLPDSVEPLLFTPLGYPAVDMPDKRRKDLDEIVHWETF
jgi:nitroreductase